MRFPSGFIETLIGTKLQITKWTPLITRVRWVLFIRVPVPRNAYVHIINRPTCAFIGNNPPVSKYHFIFCSLGYRSSGSAYLWTIRNFSLIKLKYVPTYNPLSDVVLMELHVTYQISTSICNTLNWRFIYSPWPYIISLKLKNQCVAILTTIQLNY